MKTLLFSLLLAASCIAQTPRGTIIAYGGDKAPNGWLLCDGSIQNTSQYPGLAAVLGNKFGTPGAGKFRLPDLRGRVIVGAGAGETLTPRPAGSVFGAEKILLGPDMIPAHKHLVDIKSGDNVDRGRCCVSNPNNGDYGRGQHVHKHEVKGITGGATDWGGANQHVPTVQPSAAIHYIIKI